MPAQRLPRHRSATPGLAALRLAPPPQGSSDSRALGRPRPSGSRPAAPRAAFPSVSPDSALCLPLVSPCPPPPRPPAGMSSVPLRVPVAPAPSRLDGHLPTTEVGSLARTTLLLLVRVLALGREAPCLVAPRPPPQQRHPLALASVKLQVSTYGGFFPWLSSIFETFATSLHCFRSEKEGRENRRGSGKSVRGLGCWWPWAFLWSNHCGSSLASQQVLHQSANFMGEKNKFKVIASNE